MQRLFKSFIFLSLIFPPIQSFSQIFKPGIIAGVVATDLDGVDPYDNDFHKAGLTIGASLNAKLSEKNSLQFEVLYTQKGSLQPADSVNNYNYYKLNLNYVEIPLLFKHNIVFNIKKKRIDNFFFEIGPSYGRLVTMKQEGTFDYGGGYENNFKNSEIALNIGLGCRIVNRLFFDVRYCNSIIPVVYHNAATTRNNFLFTANKGANMVWAFTLRYQFSKANEKKEVKEEEVE